MWNLKIMELFSNELIFKVEIGSQIQKTNSGLPGD